MGWPLIALAAVAVGAIFGLTSCDSEDDEQSIEYTYKTIKPILDESCLRCHVSTQQPSSQLFLDNYVKKDPHGYWGLVQVDSGRFRSVLNRPDHRSYVSDDDRAKLDRFAEQKMPYFYQSGIHHPHWLNPHEDGFHGRELARRNWDLSDCRRCHGGKDDPGGKYAGGKVAAGYGNSVQSCVSCHGESPESCTTCHGQGDDPAPPGALKWEGSLGPGAHQAHLRDHDDRIADPTPCEACHRVPDQFDDPHHIDEIPGAEVIFGWQTEFNGKKPTYYRSSGSCKDGCHGEGTPSWTQDTKMTCKSCHTTHEKGPVGEERCVTCHQSTVDETQKIIARWLHLDRKEQIGPNGVDSKDGDCQSCHNLEKDTPNPIALNWPGSFGPAAHQLHLRTNMTSPITCIDCHRDYSPKDYSSFFTPGHIDTPLPAEVWFAPNSRGLVYGGEEGWDRNSRTCRGCHSSIYSGELDRSPPWDSTPTGKGCETCHTAQPSDPHPIAVGGFQGCWTCHDNVSQDGTIIDPSKHIKKPTED